MVRTLRAALVTVLVLAGAAALPAARGDDLTICTGGRIATDEAGDDAYGPSRDSGLESRAGDILHVRSSIRPETAGERIIVSTYVDELDDTGPHHLDLLLGLRFVTDGGETIEMTARRSATGRTSGTAKGSSEGVEVHFDTVRDRIRLVVPAETFAGARWARLDLARTRYDSGAGLSPFADEVSGACVSAFDTEATPPRATLSDRDVTVLVIDTGVNAHHPEFADDQIVAWWDFSSAGGDPRPYRRTWMDTDGDGVLHGDRDDPYDPNGHGSAVASMAVGSNRIDPRKTPSACPGCRVAVAKVLDEDSGVLDGSISSAISWGVHEVGADVITVSIGSLVPIPAAARGATERAVSRARAQGVLVVFANGNGWGNAGVPGQPGGIMPYGHSADALAVGADGPFAFLVTTDPEVVAVFTVHAAGPQGAGYQDIAGTSFSAPYVAGVAARIVGEGRACATTYDLGPDSLEDLLKRVAADRAHVPPTFEGYGVVDRAGLDRAYEVVCRGGDPPGLDPVTDAYMRNLPGRLRAISSDPAPLGG